MGTQLCVDNIGASFFLVVWSGALTKLVEYRVSKFDNPEKKDQKDDDGKIDLEANPGGIIPTTDPDEEITPNNDNSSGTNGNNSAGSSNNTINVESNEDKPPEISTIALTSISPRPDDETQPFTSSNNSSKSESNLERSQSRVASSVTSYYTGSYCAM